MTPALGLLVEWLGARGLLYWRRVRVVRCSRLEVEAAEPGPRPDVREASDEDLRRLAAMHGLGVAEWRARRGQGSICLVARSGTALLGYLWITRSAERMAEVNHTLDVSRDASGAYLFDGYVLPAHRRKGVLHALLRSSKTWAAQHGLARLYAAFARENHVSEHALEREGFTTIVGDVGILRVLNREWKWIRLPREAPVIDILNATGPPRAAPHPT